MEECFAEPRTYRHAFQPREAAAAGVALWDPLRCRKCAALVGAARRPLEGRGSAVGGCGGAGCPVWFEGRSPAELGFTLQLLKSRVAIQPPCDTPAADALFAPPTATGGVAGGGGARSTEAEAAGVFSGYSMGAIVAARMLAALEAAGDDEDARWGAADGGDGGQACDPRRFAVGPDRAAPRLLLTLLNPYVAMHTNHGWGAEHLASAQLGERDGGGNGGAVDALKLLFAEAPAASTGAARPPQWVCLADDECDRLLSELRLSATMLPPFARRVGRLQAGYLAVAPTWD